MNREIKFRGLRADGKGWIIGDLVHEAHNAFSNRIEVGIRLTNCYPEEVIPETTSQFIGLKDKNGKEIYEGDKIKIWSFYHQSGTTADWFGAEPQNSQPVYEEFLETMYATVEFKNGSFIAKNANHEIPLSAVIKGLGSEVANFYMCDYGGSVSDFIESFDSLEEEKYYNELKSLEGEILYKRLEDIVNEITQEIEIIGNIHDNPK